MFINTDEGWGRIYLDAVWALNFLMDGMILYLTQGITRAKTSNLRILLGAFVASCIVPVTVLMPDFWMATITGKFFYSLLIIAAAFTFVSIRTAFIQWLTFYFVTFAIGGTLVGIHFFLNNQVQINQGEIITLSTGFGDPFSWIFVCIGFPLSWLFTKWRMEHVQAHRLKTEDLYRVKIEFNGNSIVCTGLVDSGNHLIDPISKKMVFLADCHVWRNFFNNDMVTKLTGEEQMEGIENLEEPYRSAVRLIPYQGAGTGGQLMVTFVVDHITVYTSDGDLVVKKPLLGVQAHDLTVDQMYHILIHPHAAIKGISA
ncbi:sigma-E processing peptidase SpoIIGA [Halobacillus sp. A5]|uniref:sigma-E processing peptidase SpoIIGA n=1 Tax=Halobacillus sp. A5 TaxID=2880263 RepID=UPI00211211D6|nr:sigma-E processing peptidase SpoIIGA [Halobacillus sp. A5]MCP3026203.1 sigma-E processing peptidase SpoIIGA [Halobacillus sp. A5]